VEHFLTWNSEQAVVHLVGLAVAYVLALPIGWNREHEERSAGLRTFPLVAMAACGFVMIATEVLGPDSQQHSRILEGLMTGIGFVGGGAILKQGDRAKGTATAASLWATGAIGAAVGYGQLDIAVILSLVTVLTLVLMAPLRKVVQERGDLDQDDV
jgi:putative Mg2+ transporter-C (MgtC) family protein